VFCLFAHFVPVRRDIRKEFTAAVTQHSAEYCENDCIHNYKGNDLVDQKQCGNRFNFRQDVLHLGSDALRVELGLLVEAGIKPSHLVHVADVLSQSISPLPKLECRSHQEPKGERHRKYRTNSCSMSATCRH